MVLMKIESCRRVLKVLLLLFIIFSLYRGVFFYLDRCLSVTVITVFTIHNRIPLTIHYRCVVWGMFCITVISVYTVIENENKGFILSLIILIATRIQESEIY